MLSRTLALLLLPAALLDCTPASTSGLLYPQLAPDSEGHCRIRPREATSETRLLEAGKEPRTVLAFIPTRQPTVLHVSEPAHAGLGARELTIAFEPARSTRNQACFAFELDEQSVHREASMESGGLGIDPSGTHAVTTCCATSSKTDAMLRWYVEEVLASIELGFPREPVGLGAIWVRERPAAPAAAIGSRRVTFTLVARSADSAEVDMAVDESLPSEEGAKGARATLTGRGRFRFLQGMPVPLGTMQWSYWNGAPDAPHTKHETTFSLGPHHR